MALLLGIAAALYVPAQAQTPAGNPLVAGNVIRDFARITFFWPEKIDMTATTDGNRLLVSFDRQVNPNFGEILVKLYPYVTKAELSANRRTIVFTMRRPYAIRSFITDTESGVDILNIHEEPKPQRADAEDPSAEPAQEPAAPSAAAPQPSAVANTPVLSPAPVPRSKPQPPVTTAEEPAQQAETEPAQEPEPSPAPAPEPVQEQSPQVAPAQEPAAAPQPVTPAETAQEETVTIEPAPPASAAPVVEVTTATVARLQDFGAIQGESLTVQLQDIERAPHLLFPFQERVAAAVWQRGRTVMVIFDKPVTLSGLDTIRPQARTWLGNAEQLGGEAFTLLRIDLSTDLHVKAYKEREGYGWLLRISETPTYPEDTVSPAINRSTGKPYVFLPATDMGNTYHLRDPQVGDPLDVTTLHATSTGIFPPRGFVEFNLLGTQQGFVVAPLSEDVRVDQIPNGVRISSPQGLFITEDIDDSAVAQSGSRDHLFKPSLFPAREWRAQNNEDFWNREIALQNGIATAETPDERNRLRMKLAQLYFTEGLYNETLGVVNTIRRDDLDFFRNNRLAALEGASYLLNYRLPEAALSLSSDTLEGLEEGELLRKTVAASLSPEAEPVPYMHYNDAYIRQYPNDLRQRIALIAANHAIRNGDFRSPSDIFDSLEEDKLSGEVGDYIDYLKAKVAAEAGRTEEAERIWGRLADKVEDRQFRARSEYSLVLMGLEEGTLTPAQAIERLEKLRIVWRGDDLEQSLLTVLGQLYVNQNQYWEGMKAWEELLDNFPNSPEALAAYQRLAETFRALFLDDEADNIEPVKALALYSEFQELTPLGADGNRMIQKLVDRLVAVDLLGEAAARLENQIQYRLEGEEKSRVGARLAVIYLLNREPEKALTALQNSRVDGVPAALSLERNRIAAQALIDLERGEQALSMIEGDYSADGENVRLEAYWAKEDWAYVIDIIELMLRKRTDLNAPFTEREGQRLLQLALAYIFVGEGEQLRYLREAYAPLMKDNPYREEFMFLTQDRVPTSGENFSAVIENIGSMESFMDGYRDRLQSGDISETVGTGTTAEDATAPANPQ